MKEPYGEGLASHTGFESCAWDSREAAREALTGAQAGRVLSREMNGKQSADAVRTTEGNIDGREKVSWVLDADIRDFFGTISHEWMVKFLQHRIADRRILRLIQKWLRAGVSEDGEWSKTEV